MEKVSSEAALCASTFTEVGNPNAGFSSLLLGFN